MGAEGAAAAGAAGAAAPRETPRSSVGPLRRVRCLTPRRAAGAPGALGSGAYLDRVLGFGFGFAFVFGFGFGLGRSGSGFGVGSGFEFGFGYMVGVVSSRGGLALE